MSMVFKSAKLLSWQPDCVSSFENMDKGETLVICSQRQVGKSFTCTQILLYVALNCKKSVSIYISPTNDSSRKFFNDIKRMVENSGLTTKINESLLVIEFITGSSIFFRSAESKLRGYSCRNNGILVVDEAQFVPDDIWEIILPFTNVDNSKKIIISTPKFKKGQFWKFYSMALAGEDGYHLISTADYDTSMFLNEKLKEEYKKMLSPQAYKSEILGEWLDNGDCLFGDYSKIFYTPEDKNPIIAGIDWSNNGGDNTVFSAFNSKNQQCNLDIFTDINDPVERTKKIAEKINSYPTLQKVICEKNSLGEVYLSVLKKYVNNPYIIQEFTTTNDSKCRIIEKMISNINQGNITLLPSPQMDMELSGYELQSLKSGKHTYNGKKDDCIMATAFAIDSIFSVQGCYMIGHTHKRN